MLSFFRHVCDSIWQCPYGDDEHQRICKSWNCSGLFLCNQTPHICLHLVSICDGFADCQSAEDEMLCELPHVCAKECQCLMYAVSCTQWSTVSLLLVSLLKNFISLHLNQVYTQHHNIRMVINPTHTNFLVWTYSHIDDICCANQNQANNILYLDCSSNDVRILTVKCFGSFERLKVVVISHNNITTIKTSAFIASHKYALINLTGNALITLDTFFFFHTNVYCLDIRFTHWKVTFEGSLELLVAKLFTDDSRLCCICGGCTDHCSAPPRWPQTCVPHLFRNAVQKTLRFMFIFCIVFNFSAIVLTTAHILQATYSQTLQNIYQHKQQANMKQSVPFLVNILWVNLNDIFASLHLLCVYISAVHFDNKFLMYSIHWLSSAFCKTLSFMSIMVSLSSLFLLNLLTFSRLFAAKYPFRRTFKSSTKILKLIVGGLGLNFIFSISVFHLYSFVEGNDTMPWTTCSFHGDNKSSISVKAFLTVLIVSQLSTVCAISCEHWQILSEMKRERPAMSTYQVKTGFFILQCLLTTVGCGVSWIGSVAIYMASLVLPTYPTQIIVWNTILIVPIVSLMNPSVLVVLPILKTLRQKIVLCQ